MRRSSCGYSRKSGLAKLAGIALILALSLGSGSALAQDEPTPEPVGPETEEIDLLFSHDANSGVFRDRGERPGKILVLHGVSRTTWFESHPGRQSGHLPTRGFVRSWEGFGFRKDPPNAALTVRGRHGTVTSVLELRNPHYRARTDTVRYRAEVLGADEAQDSFDENQARPPRRFKDASLFVDDAAAPVVNGCVLQPYTNCVGADLWGEGLLRANLSNANLSNANLGNADLSGADLSYANLTHADLSYAYLSYANLFYADLTGALAVGTYMTDTMFCRTTMPDGEIQTNWNGDGCR